MPNNIAANMRMIIFGLLLVLIVRFKSKENYGEIEDAMIMGPGCGISSPILKLSA